MNPKKNDEERITEVEKKKNVEELITEVKKIEISLELVKAFIDTWKGKKIWFSGKKWKTKKKQAKEALEYLEFYYNREKDEESEDVVVDFEIVISCSCNPKL